MPSGPLPPPAARLAQPGAAGARRSERRAMRGRRRGQGAAAAQQSGRGGPRRAPGRRGDANTRARASGRGRRGGRLEGLALRGARVQLAALMLARRHHLRPQRAGLLLPSAPVAAHVPRTARAETPRLPPRARLAPRRWAGARAARAARAAGPVLLRVQLAQRVVLGNRVKVRARRRERGALARARGAVDTLLPARGAERGRERERRSGRANVGRRNVEAGEARDFRGRRALGLRGRCAGGAGRRRRRCPARARSEKAALGHPARAAPRV
jgi:hypothetical protein